MSFTPPFSAPVPRTSPTTVFIIAIRFDEAMRYLDLLCIPVGRWVYAGDARQLLGAMRGSTLLVCPGGYKNPKFTEVYNRAKLRDFNILYLDEEKHNK